MPRFYCDYCDVYLTHDSRSVRKSHNLGWKHRMQVQNYYSCMIRMFNHLALDPSKVEAITTAIAKAYENYVPPGNYLAIDHKKSILCHNILALYGCLVDFRQFLQGFAHHRSDGNHHLIFHCCLECNKFSLIY